MLWTQCSVLSFSAQVLHARDVRFSLTTLVRNCRLKEATLHTHASAAEAVNPYEATDDTVTQRMQSMWRNILVELWVSLPKLPLSLIIVVASSHDRRLVRWHLQCSFVACKHCDVKERGATEVHATRVDSARTAKTCQYVQASGCVSRV